MLEDQASRIKHALKQGLPPDDLRPFHLELESFQKAFYRIFNEIKEIHTFISIRLVALVGQRGFGKTHIFQTIENCVKGENLPYFVIRIDMKRTLVDTFYEIAKKLGKNFFLDLKNAVIQKYNCTDDSTVFSQLLNVTDDPMLSTAIVRIEYEADEGIIWKWLTKGIGFQEINRVRHDGNRISRNLKEKDVLDVILALAKLSRDVLDRCLVLLIDEVAVLTCMKRKEQRNFKHFLVELINKNLPISIFVLLGCISSSWEELTQDPYSVNIGLSRRLLSIELFGLSNFDEAKSLAENIIAFYRETETSSFNIENEILETLYDESNRNPGYFIKNLVAEIERQITEARVFDILPLEIKAKQKGEEALRSLDPHAIKNFLWEFVRDLLKEYNPGLSDQNFSSFFIRSIRHSQGVIKPSFSCSIRPINFVAEAQIKLDQGPSRIGITTLLPIISALRYDMIDCGIIFLIGNVIQEFTPGPRGSAIVFEENRDINDQIHFIKLDVDELKIIIGYHILKRLDPNVPAEINTLEEHAGQLYNKISEILMDYSPDTEQFYRKEDVFTTLTHLRHVEGLRNVKSAEHLDIRELTKLLMFVLRSEERCLDLLVDSVNLRLSDLNQSSERQRSDALENLVELFELLVKKSRERMDEPLKSVIYRRHATLGKILVAKIRSNELRNNPDLHYIKINNQFHVGILINFDWYEGFAYVFPKYSSYSSRDSVEDANRKLKILLRNDFSSDQEFQNKFSRKTIEETPRIFTLTGLLRNYLQHPNPQFLAITDISTFKDTFDLVLTAILDLFSIGRTKHLYPTQI